MAVTSGRTQRTVAVITIAWGVILAIGAVWAIMHGKPTAREQTTVAQAEPTVDTAIAQIAAAASVDGDAIVAISGFERLGDCAVTMIRGGTRYQRTVTAIVTPGTEGALLQRVGARLPAAYRMSVRQGTAPRLVGDAGFFVGLTGGVAAPGVVRFIADTGGCRPEGLVTAAVTTDPSTADRAPLTAAMDLLRVPVRQWNSYRVACPAGGTMTTVEAVGAGDAVAGPLDTTLRALAPTIPTIATPELFGYRVGGVGIAVRGIGGPVVATATTDCQ